jgi:multiple antibiotic resistance protein
MGDWTEYSRFLTALLAIMDPFMAIPVFLSLTEGRSPAERARTALIAAVTVTVVLLGTALAGESILRLMGTSLASFRVGGGLVLLLMAVAMLRAEAGAVRQTPEESQQALGKAAVGAVPLGIPLLAGPGAISTVIIQMHRGGLVHKSLVLLTILMACAIIWLTLRLAVPIGNRLGTIGLNIANRLLGLVLAAIAIEIMATGLRALFPVLAGA